MIIRIKTIKKKREEGEESKTQNPFERPIRPNANFERTNKLKLMLNFVPIEIYRAEFK